MVGSSVAVWQEMQPADLRWTSSGDWPRNGEVAGGSCSAAEAVRERMAGHIRSAVMHKAASEKILARPFCWETTRVKESANLRAPDVKCFLKM